MNFPKSGIVTSSINQIIHKIDLFHKMNSHLKTVRAKRKEGGPIKHSDPALKESKQYLPERKVCSMKC